MWEFQALSLREEEKFVEGGEKRKGVSTYMTDITKRGVFGSGVVKG